MDINAKDIFGNTIWNYVISGGNIDIIRLLIENGADVNAKDGDGRTLLMIAAYNDDKNIDIIRLFLDMGLDINAKDKDGETPLMRAAREGNIDIARLLVEKGADIDAKDNDDHTALWYASICVGSIGIVQLLLEKGANPENIQADRTEIAELLEKARNKIE